MLIDLESDLWMQNQGQREVDIDVKSIICGMQMKSMEGRVSGMKTPHHQAAE
jgi:hypothetical protein